MTPWRSLCISAAVCSIGAVLDLPAARAESPAAAVRPAGEGESLFDPARHMRVSEVKAGMTGYGLTVFHGSKIERFDVQVLSVLKNFNAKSDVVLIRCKGEYLEHTGSIAGMSGSPIYLRDDAGRDRMIGAFAYGWPLTKDPVAGVQPIEYMLQLAAARNVAAENAGPATAPSAAVQDAGGSAGPQRRASWSLKDAGMLPLMWRGRIKPAALRNGAEARPGALAGEGDAPRLQPLATPLMIGGISPELLDQLGPRFRAAGLSPLQAGTGGSAVLPQADILLEPGSVLAVPLLTGDMEMTAIGTTTEVIGDRVWGFGHPFNNEGNIALPMGSGVINGIIANLQTSFKLGALTQARGTLTTDASVGVAGLRGAAPATVPLELVVERADGVSRSYHFNVSRHPRFTALIAAAAFGGAVSGSSELPQYNTVDYDVRLAFSNGRTITLANRAVNSTSGDLFSDAAIVLQAASENPFERVMVNQINATVKVRPVAQSAQIIDVNLPKSLYHPGDKVSAFVTYQPFHGSETILPVNLDLPHDLPPGQYQLVISDAQRYFADEQASKPFRFKADNIDDVFNVLKDMAAIRENGLFLRLLKHPDGVAIGHTALPNLPSSRREILLASGRSNTTPFVSSMVKIVPSEYVMAGSSEFMIDVEPVSKVAVSGARPAKVEPAPGPPSKGEEPKKAAAPEAPVKKDAGE